MERLIVANDGSVIIPPEVVHKRGLHPGDELTLVESAEGLLVYQGGVDAQTLGWWESLSEQEKSLAKIEAQNYESLSEAERELLWNEEAESLEEAAEGDEIELPAK